MKKITIKNIEKMIQNSITENKRDLAEHNEIKEKLTPFNGKSITAKLIEKHLPDYKIEFAAGMVYITNKNTNNRHLISYNTTLTIENFADYDTCYYYGSIERIEKLQMLDVKKMYDIYSQIEKHFNALRNLFGDIETEKLGSFNNPLYSDLLMTIYDHTKHNNCLVLRDFYYIRNQK